MEKQPLVVLTGPTAAGKTKLSIELARAINGEIISADSMQVYRHMDIGSAKIRPEEMEGIPHYLVDILEPTQDFNVVLFQKYAKDAMAQIYAKGKIPILVGGTGFYIQSVLYDIDFTDNDNDTSLRAELESFIMETYNAETDYPWLKYPNYEVFRHCNNRKWFALIMDVPKNKLGLQGEEMLEVVDFKCDPILIGTLREEPGFFPAYHMSKDSWITVALDVQRIR